MEHGFVSKYQADDIRCLAQLGEFSEGTTTGVDVVDAQHNIARVWLFLRKGRLYACGSSADPGRDPDALGFFITRPRMIRTLRLATPRW